MEVVFDFDGTIADTFTKVVEIINRFAPDYGYSKLGKKEIGLYRSLGTKKARKAFGVSWIQFLRIGRRVIKELNRDIDNVKIFPGMRQVIIELKKRGLVLGMLSSDSRQNIDDFLKKNKLDDVFDYIGLSGLLWGKARKLKKIKRAGKLADDQLLYVGDDTKDVIACHKARVKSLAVTWGYNSEKSLRSYKPDFVAKTPKQIVKIVDKILA